MSELEPAFVEKLRTAHWLPELPEAAAFDTLSCLLELEAGVVQNAAKRYQDTPIVVEDYSLGSADYEDHLMFANTEAGDVLVSAEHATVPFRKVSGTSQGADYGTGGLALLLARKEGAAAVVPRGCQTPHSRKDKEHVFKQVVRSMLPSRLGLVAVHGMFPGKVIDLTDPVELHAVIGLGEKTEKGKHPNESSVLVAEGIVSKARELGLRAEIATGEADYVNYDPATQDYMRDDSGKVRLSKMTAAAPSTMVSTAYTAMEQHGILRPAVQIEMTRLLLLMPTDLEKGWHKDPKARAMGVYRGYLLCKESIDLTRKAASNLA